MDTPKPEKKDRHGLHVFVWRLLQPIAAVLCWLKFRFTAARSSVKGPFLLVSNHNTDWDPILVALSFPRQQMYYVTSEHLLRSGLGGRIVSALQDPIPRQKGGHAADTVLTMMRRMKKGYNVAVFPEGNRSWDGVTRPFLPSIGKLARSSGASLVTYRMTGGYFANPRWAGSASRRGRMRGEVVRIYSPEELKAMKPAEIYEHIREDLKEDAYSRQRKNPILFRGRHLAEHMETLLFLCPKCGRMHTLQSRGDTVSCWKCGFSFRYLPTGFLAGDGIPFDNLRDWTAWQEGEIRRLCDEADDEHPIFTDADMRLDEVHFSEGLKLLGKGEMKLYKDRLELPGVTLPVGDITGISLRGPQDIYFGTETANYLVRSRFVRCTVKYLTACSYLNGGREYGV